MRNREKCVQPTMTRYERRLREFVIKFAGVELQSDTRCLEHGARWMALLANTYLHFRYSYQLRTLQTKPASIITVIDRNFFSANISSRMPSQCDSPSDIFTACASSYQPPIQAACARSLLLLPDGLGITQIHTV